MVLQHLAQIHAYSYAWIDTYFGGLSNFEKDFWPLTGDNWLYAENQEMEVLNDTMCNNAFDFLIVILEAMDYDQSVIDRVKAFSKVRMEVVKSVHPPKGTFNCMSHGDAWSNNFMFK